METKSTPILFQKRLYSINDLVREVGATEWFWRSQIWDGRLPFVKVGKKLFVDSQDIDTFITNYKLRN
jgi:hypothetical protein